MSTTAPAPDAQTLTSARVREDLELAIRDRDARQALGAVAYATLAGIPLGDVRQRLAPAAAAWLSGVLTDAVRRPELRPGRRV
jgi:hypothetical protein